MLRGRSGAVSRRHDRSVAIKTNQQCSLRPYCTRSRGAGGSGGSACGSATGRPPACTCSRGAMCTSISPSVLGCRLPTASAGPLPPAALAAARSPQWPAETERQGWKTGCLSAHSTDVIEHPAARYEHASDACLEQASVLHAGAKPAPGAAAGCRRTCCQPCFPMPATLHQPHPPPPPPGPHRKPGTPGRSQGWLTR